MKTTKIRGRTFYLVPCHNCGSEIKRIKSTLKDINNCRKCASLINIEKALAVSTNQNKQDNNYFEKMSLQACYWAGFIAADGYINKKQSKLEISIKDRGHLDEFKKDSLASNKVEKITLSRGYLLGSTQERIRITNKKWLLDLENIFNIKSKKSLNHEAPNISNWSIEQIKSFIVGNIDGDGCITGFEKNNGQLNICGTLNFLEFIKNFFESTYDIKLSSKCIRKSKTIHRLFLYTGKAKKVLDDLKQLPTYKLERKWCKV